MKLPKLSIKARRNAYGCAFIVGALLTGSLAFSGGLMGGSGGLTERVNSNTPPSGTFTVTGAGGINLATGSTAKFTVADLRLFANGVGPVLDATDNAPIQILGNATDGASAIGVILSNKVTLANATAKLLSVQNNGTPWFDISPTGTLRSQIVQGGINGGDTSLYIRGSTATTSVLFDSGIYHFTDTKSGGAITLSGGTGTATTFSGAKCVCTDTTANVSVKCTVAATTLTATGTTTDVINYFCF